MKSTVLAKYCPIIAERVTLVTCSIQSPSRTFWHMLQLKQISDKLTKQLRTIRDYVPRVIGLKRLIYIIALNEPPALRRKAATDKMVEKIVKHDSWPIQPDILSPPLLRLTSRKPLWLDLQPVHIKSRWRHNWKSAQVVNSHLVCDPTIRQPGFDLRRQQWSFLNRFFARCRDTAVPAEGSGDLQTPSGSRRNDTEQCLTLSNPVP